jgi:phenylacetate-CoA ligase
MSPAWSRSLASTVYGFLKNRRELTPQFTSILAGLEESQWLPSDRLRTLQAERLRALVRHAATNVPYYRRVFAEHGLSPSQVQTPDDLSLLPTLSKETIRSEGENLIAAGYARRSLRSESTSGTSGVPLTVWMDDAAYTHTKAVQWLQHGWAGYTHREWIGILAGYRVMPLARRRPPFWISNHAGRQVHFSTYHLKPEFMPSMVRKLKESRIQFLLGYPSAIGLLARHLVERGDSVPIRAVFPSSEPLYRWQVEAMEKAFGCTVFNYYGQGEKAISGTGCGTSINLHVNMEICVAETLPAPAGGSYRLLVGTPLHNYAMPLLRYELHDLTTVVTEPCACGRQHQRFGPVETVSDNYILAPDGSLLSPSVLYLAFPTLRGLSGAQIVQQDLHTLVIRVIAGDAFTSEESQRLIAGVRRVVGEEFRLEIEKVDDIARTRNGKVRFVVSHLSQAALGQSGTVE